ncbi:MAG: Nif3-like dinuclear metal center hexameric protein [Desulfotignum sp.]
MTPTVKQILLIIDDIAPCDLAESWDNSGLCAGSLDWPVQKILVGLDPGMQVMRAARQWKADMVLTHHPLFITPEKTIDFGHMPGSAIAIAAKEHIAVVCAHTNLDKAQNGLNDFFADRIGVVVTHPLVPDPNVSDQQHIRTGIGRIGEVTSSISLARMASDIKKQLGIHQIRVVGNMDIMVKKIALCTGSGGSLVPVFLQSDADLFITGDIKYHEARLVEEHGKALIDVGHFASEILAVDLLSGRMVKAASLAGYDLEIKGFNQETDPFAIV